MTTGIGHMTNFWSKFGHDDNWNWSHDQFLVKITKIWSRYQFLVNFTRNKKPDRKGLRVLVTSKESRLDFIDVDSIKKVSKNWKHKALAENDKKRSSEAGPYFLLNMEVLILEVSGKSLALVQLHRGVSESGVNPEVHQGHNQKRQLGRSNDVSASNWWR